MKNIIKSSLLIVFVSYMLLLTESTGNQLMLALGLIALLDRGAAWFDRKVPNTDPRKHT